MTSAHQPRAERQGQEAVPRFEPHPWLRNGHVQTVAGRYFPGQRFRFPFQEWELPVGDGDRLVVLDSTPIGWGPGAPVAVLIHGLAGSADAPYVARLAGLLFESGTRVVRMNLRGAGSGFDKARGTYHAGRTEDVRRVAAWAAEGAPGSPIGLVGFSLGGNLALKLAAEAGNTPLPGLDCVVAANPPIDLAASCRYIQRPGSRVYDRQFVKLLVADVKRRHRTFPDLGPVAFPKLMSLFDFDERYTAPRNGFQGARDYYARSSSRPLIPGIRVPGLVIHSEDDPFIPVEPFLETVFPENLSLELTPSGGHLGYLSRASWNGSRRWLDHRIMTWLKTRWGCGFAPDLVA